MMRMICSLASDRRLRNARNAGLVTERSTAPGAAGRRTKVALKLDIDAEAPADFPSDVVDVVNANPKALKFGCA